MRLPTHCVRGVLRKVSMYRPKRYITSCRCHRVELMQERIWLLSANRVMQRYTQKAATVGIITDPGRAVKISGTYIPCNGRGVSCEKIAKSKG